jgi:hypothetical protein
MAKITLSDSILDQGAKRRGRRTVKNSKTSPRALALVERRKACLDLRKQGQSYRQIAEHFRIAPTTAQSHVIAAVKDLMPVDQRAEVLQLELDRLDAMQSSIAANAEKGDLAAIKVMLDLMALRAKYLGLHPTGGSGNVNVNIANNNGTPDARQTGIQVTMVDFKASREGEVVPADFQVDPLRTIEHQPLAIDKPPAHLTSSTAPNPAAVPAQPASRPKKQNPWDNAATDSQLFPKPKNHSWMS